MLANVGRWWATIKTTLSHWLGSILVKLLFFTVNLCTLWRPQILHFEFSSYVNLLMRPYNDKKYIKVGRPSQPNLRTR